MKPILIYCYDAYAEWCYGFIPVITALEKRLVGIFDFEVLSGGLLPSAKPVALIADYFLATYPEVENKSGIKFGEDFLWHIKNPSESDWFPKSLKPAVALCVFKEYYVDRQIEFAKDLSTALFAEGRDLCDDEAYRHLLDKYELPVEEFYAKLGSDEYQRQAREDFDTVKKLGVIGYPSLFLQLQPEKIIQLTGSYCSLEEIDSELYKIFILSKIFIQ